LNSIEQNEFTDQWHGKESIIIKS